MAFACAPFFSLSLLFFPNIEFIFPSLSFSFSPHACVRVRLQENSISFTQAEEYAKKIDEAQEELKLAKGTMSAELSSLQQKLDDALATLEESEQRVFDLSEGLAKSEAEMKKAMTEKMQLEVWLWNTHPLEIARKLICMYYHPDMCWVYNPSSGSLPHV